MVRHTHASDPWEPRACRAPQTPLFSSLSLSLPLVRPREFTVLALSLPLSLFIRASPPSLSFSAVRAATLIFFSHVCTDLGGPWEKEE